MADDTRAEVESHRTQDSRAELKETRLAAGAAEQREDGRRKEFAADLVPREGRLFEDPHRSALTHGGKCGHPTTWTARISTPPRRHQFQNSRCRGICSEPAGGAGGARLRSILFEQQAQFSAGGQAAPPAPPAKLWPSKGMAQPIFPARQKLRGEIRRSESRPGRHECLRHIGTTE